MLKAALPARFLAGLLIAMLVVCVAFAFAQNHGWLVGGTISVAKTLWLDLALSAFYVIPFCLWKDARIARRLRGFYGWFLLGFVVRGVLELAVLYSSHSWRCIYGIGHDVLMLALLGTAGGNRGNWGNWGNWGANGVDGRGLGRGFLGWLAVVLCFEAANAWLFSRLADPGAGIYFAADTVYFRNVNRLTWLELAILYPWLALCLSRYWKGGSVA